MEYRDYYAILGVDKKADQKAIKSAYRGLARRFHPDQNKDPGAVEKFKEINEAYEVLSDPEKRSKYDTIPPGWNEAHGFSWNHDGARHAGPWRKGQDGQGVRFTFGSRGADGFSDFFRTFFTGDAANFQSGAADPFGDYQRGSYKGADYEGHLTVTLREAFSGTEKTVRVNGADIRVKVPAGISTGTKLRLAGQGGEGGQRARRGDLYLKVKVLPHGFFSLQGKDLVCDLPVTADEAAMGADVEFPSFKGTVKVKIPPGSQSGDTLRLKGMGMPGEGGTSPGSILVKIMISVPSPLSEEEQHIFQELRRVSSHRPRSTIVI